MSDLLKVKGITPEMFERSSNILTVESSAFTVEVEAQTLKSLAMKDGAKLVENDISASRKKRFVIELDRKPNGLCSIDKLEIY